MFLVKFNVFFSRQFQPKQSCHFQENAGENALCCNVKTTLAVFSLCTIHALAHGVEIWSEYRGLSISIHFCLLEKKKLT